MTPSFLAILLPLALALAPNPSSLLLRTKSPSIELYDALTITEASKCVWLCAASGKTEHCQHSWRAHHDVTLSSRLKAFFLLDHQSNWADQITTRVLKMAVHFFLQTAKVITLLPLPSKLVRSKDLCLMRTNPEYWIN